MNMERRIKLQVWGLLLAVFALGAVTGAALDGVYRSRGGKVDGLRSAGQGPMRRGFDGPPIEMIVRRMGEDLKLSDEQVTEIRTIFEETRREIPRNLPECPGFKEARERTQSRIRTVLTPEQQQRFDEINAEREASFGRPRPR